MCSKVGKAVYDLQNQLPNARVVYVSATIATSVRDMEFMTRLGLWGTKSSAFKEAEIFFDFVEERGMAGCEIVACEMKSRGIYISRNLTYHGITFDEKILSSSADIISLYNRCVVLWQKIIEITPIEMQSQLWATCQKFFRAMCISAKLPKTIEIIQQARNENKSIVVGIQSTGEAAYVDFRKYGYHNTGVAFSPCRVYIEKFLNKLEFWPAELGSRYEGTFVKNSVGIGGDPTKVRKRKLPEPESSSEESSNSDSDSSAESSASGNSGRSESNFKSSKKSASSSSSNSARTSSESSSSSSDSSSSSSSESSSDNELQNSSSDKMNKEEHLNDRPIVQNMESRQPASTKEQIITIFKAIAPLLPLNTLDVLLAEFGYDKVAELTGRKRYQPLMKIDSEYKPGPCEVFRRHDVTNTGRIGFQAGAFRIAIISEAAATGISLHSSNTATNKDPRLHIILEAPWAAVNACQQIGRTHRTNQAHCPSYLILMSDIPGEARFASALGRRMKSLAALSKGDRMSHGSVWSKYEVDPKTAHRAIRDLINDIIGNESRVNQFTSPQAIRVRTELKEELLKLGIIFEGEDRMRVHVVEYDKILNRTLCMEVTTQKKFLSCLDTAIDSAEYSKDFSQEQTEIKDLTELVDPPFAQINTEEFEVRSGNKAVLSIYQKHNVLTWDTVQNITHGMNDVSYYSKLCESGRQKVCLARKIVGPTTYFEVYTPHQMLSTKKAGTFFKQNRYRNIQFRELAEQYWKEAESFYTTGKCYFSFRHNLCKQNVCDHISPLGKFGVIVGGILSVWDNLERALGKPLVFVRYNTSGRQILGIYVPQEKLNTARLVLESIVLLDKSYIY